MAALARRSSSGPVNGSQDPYEAGPNGGLEDPYAGIGPSASSSAAVTDDPYANEPAVEPPVERGPAPAPHRPMEQSHPAPAPMPPNPPAQQQRAPHAGPGGGGWVTGQPAQAYPPQQSYQPQPYQPPQQYPPPQQYQPPQAQPGAGGGPRHNESAPGGNEELAGLLRRAAEMAQAASSTSHAADQIRGVFDAAAVESGRLYAAAETEIKQLLSENRNHQDAIAANDDRIASILEQANTRAVRLTDQARGTGVDIN